ncbi:MAG TPA: hypothetical protein VMV57_06280 [Terracidiphilus sp.]|nr:hypothetical protein [Terracidiphilus sp.]
MKFSLARTLAIVAVAPVLALAVTAQSAPIQSVPAQSVPAPPAPQNPKPGSQVIFSRSTDANGQTTTEAGPAAPQPRILVATKPSVQDADRRAVTFTALNLDVHLHPADHQIAVRALLTVRNDGKTPLARIPLQISSALNWDQIRVEGRDVSFPVATLNSDADHTGQLHEAAVPLATPLAPGASLHLDVAYSGVILASAKRLLALGTPRNLAFGSDWDQITVPFTGLRGFGNVVWYPVSSVPAILGDGARLFDEIGSQKLRLQGARFTLHLAVEFPHGEPPTVALVNGQSVSLEVKDGPGPDPTLEGIATAQSTTTVGFQVPSLFVAIRTAHAGTHCTAWTQPADEVAVQDWVTEAAAVSPFLESWLGQHSRSNLTLLDLPDPDDTPYESGSLLVVSLQDQPAAQLDGIFVHALTHAWLQPSPAWLDEGVAYFMSTLWVEQHQGRNKALEMLEADRTALALAEPVSPGESAGQPLASAILPIYYRTKAAYVFWMLRDLASDANLSAALQALAKAPPSPAGPSLEDLLRKAGVTRDLSWFFADWVHADKGLPDLSIVSVFPSAAQAGAYLVAVNMANTGYAAAEVPLTVRTATTSLTQRVLIPARGTLVRRLLVLGKPTQVQLNDGTVPESEASVHVTHLKDAPPSSNSSSSQSADPEP